MPSAKPKPSDVASETKRHYIPVIQRDYASVWPTHSYLFRRPNQQINLPPPSYAPEGPRPPIFSICHGDPVDFTLEWEQRAQRRIPFICAANDKRPGGDWETGVVGYEERLCRRSNLSATLSNPGPGSALQSNYPIPTEGGIFSEFVVVFRGPHDQYKKLDQWYDLPVISMTACRWPKLSNVGATYAFPLEREMMMNKIRAALRICVYYGFRDVVIGDFGLGNGHRNPPQELAELWREVFLYDPELRGQFDYVAFVFEDVYQSTTKFILDDIHKKSKGPHAITSKSKSSKSHASSGAGAAPNGIYPSDYDIFRAVFDQTAVQTVLSSPDPRCGISMLTS